MIKHKGQIRQRNYYNFDNKKLPHLAADGGVTPC